MAQNGLFPNSMRKGGRWKCLQTPRQGHEWTTGMYRRCMEWTGSAHHRYCSQSVVHKDFRYSRLDWQTQRLYRPTAYIISGQTNSNSASAHGPFLFIYAGRGRSRAAGKTSADAYVFNVILHDFDMSWNSNYVDLTKYQNIVIKIKLYSACYRKQFCVISFCIEVIVNCKSCGETECP